MVLIRHPHAARQLGLARPLPSEHRPRRGQL